MEGNSWYGSREQFLTLPGVIDVGVPEPGHVVLRVEPWVDTEALVRYLEPVRMINQILEAVSI